MRIPARFLWLGPSRTTLGTRGFSCAVSGSGVLFGDHLFLAPSPLLATAFGRLDARKTNLWYPGYSRTNSLLFFTWYAYLLHKHNWNITISSSLDSWPLNEHYFHFKYLVLSRQWIPLLRCVCQRGLVTRAPCLQRKTGIYALIPPENWCDIITTMNPGCKDKINEIIFNIQVKTDAHIR